MHVYHVVVACETWLDQSFKTLFHLIINCIAVVVVMEMVVFLLLIIDNTIINCQPLQLCDSCELYAVKPFLPTNHSLTIIGAHKPPNRDMLYAENLCSTIYYIVSKHPNSFICYLGDFNLPDIDWNTESISSYRYPLP